MVNYMNPVANLGYQSQLQPQPAISQNMGRSPLAGGGAAPMGGNPMGNVAQPINPATAPNQVNAAPAGGYHSSPFGAGQMQNMYQNSQPGYGAWQPPGSWGNQGNQQYNPQAPPQYQQQPQNNMENNVLSSNNPQEVSNFMNALKQSGAGTNNTFMNNPGSNPMQQPQVQNLIGSYNGNNNMGPNQVAYNYGYQPQNTQIHQGPSAGQINTGNPQTTPKVQGNQIPSPQPTQQLNNVTYPKATGSTINAPPVQPTQPSAQPSAQPIRPQLQGNQVAMSDVTAKTHVQDGGYKVQSFLNAIKAHEYEYKNPEQHGTGKFISPMAQELEKTDVGKSAIIETKAGKMVDYGRLGGIQLAALSYLNKRINEINSFLKYEKIIKKHRKS